jgi:hypothetical protein
MSLIWIGRGLRSLKREILPFIAFSLIRGTPRKVTLLPMRCALIVALFASSALAQAPAPVTEAAAARYTYSGFLTDSAHAILSPDVKIGPELRRRLALPEGADSRAIYDALARLTDRKDLRVRRATPEELAGYAMAGGLKPPVFALQAGDTTLLIQYDLQANNIPYVGQLAGPLPAVEKPAPPPAEPAPPLPPIVEIEKPRPPVAEARKPEPRKPSGPCVVKPVMSDQDLANCGAAPR